MNWLESSEEEILQIYGRYFDKYFPSTQLQPGAPSKDVIYWLTVNPKPTVDLTAFVTQMTRVLNRCLVDKCIYSFEQRGENNDELGKGLHMHAIVWPGRTYKTSFCQRFRDATANLVGCPNKHIWIVKAKPEWVAQKKDYILGIKWDSEKDRKCMHDRVWREREGLSPYYTKNMEFGGISTSDSTIPPPESPNIKET